MLGNATKAPTAIFSCHGSFRKTYNDSWRHFCKKSFRQSSTYSFGNLRNSSAIPLRFLFSGITPNFLMVPSAMSQGFTTIYSTHSFFQEIYYIFPHLGFSRDSIKAFFKKFLTNFCNESIRNFSKDSCKKFKGSFSLICN